MASGGASVPIVFWGSKPPSHEITCICLCNRSDLIATGSKSGQVCLWTLERDQEGLRIIPYMLLFSEHSEVLSLSPVKPATSGDSYKLAVLSSNGTVRLWDMKEKVCLRHCTLPGQHKAMKVFERWSVSGSLLVVYGQYSDIFLVTITNLKLVYILKSDHSPNWIEHCCFLPNVEHRDALLATATDGNIKVWCLPPSQHGTNVEELIEDSSKGFDIKNVVSLTSHASKGFSRVLAVTQQMWIVFEATGGHLRPLYSENNIMEMLKGGDFVTMETVIIWGEDGAAFLHQLPPPTLEASPAEEAPLIKKLVVSRESPCRSHLVYNVIGGSTEDILLVGGDETGRLLFWDIKCESRGRGEKECVPLITGALSDSWSHPVKSPGLSDTLFPQGEVPPMTCAIHLDSIGRLVCGHEDGTVVMFYPSQAATVLLLSPRRFTAGWPQHCILKKHVGRVNTFLYPNAFGDRYDNKLLLSGGEDFTVRLWNLYAGCLVTTYSVHGGPVVDLMAVPKDLSLRYHNCVCSIGLDHSVAILALQERNCVFLASCHDAPVETVRWRPYEDFLIVGCNNSKVYVWQLETGTLDRCIDGATGEVVLKHSIQSPQVSTDQTQPTALKVVNLHPLPTDPIIQVLLFNPQVIINLLSKAPELLAKPHQKQRQQIQKGFRQYLHARKQFTEVSVPGKVPDKMSDVDKEIAKEKMGEKMAAHKDDQLQGEWPKQIINIVRLLLSCLHAWQADNNLDKDLEKRVGLLKPVHPISFGMMSRGNILSLVLPGWGQKRAPPRPGPAKRVGLTTPLQLPLQLPRMSSIEFFDIHDLRWHLAQLLTTQHLLTVVSISNTLMNHIKGAQLLASSASEMDPLGDDSDEEDKDEGTRDNLLRACWSQVTALHCVMLPEKQGKQFKSPNLTLLAEKYPDKCVEVREAAQALLQSELRRVGPDGRAKLIHQWSRKLPSQAPVSPKTPVVEEPTEVVTDNLDQPTSQATPLQQYTALIILGVIGAEFCRHTNKKGSDVNVMDSGVARQVAKALQAVILDRPQASLSLATSWRRSAVDLMGRGFHLWSNHVTISRILSGLLELCLLAPLSKKTNGSSKVSLSNQMMGLAARKALSLMVISAPRLLIDTLAKEVLCFLQSTHTMHYPHSTLHPVPVGIATPQPTSGITMGGEDLLLNSKNEILSLLETAVDKSHQDVSLMLVDVVDILLFCMSPDQLKKDKNLFEMIPIFKRLTSHVSYSPRSRKLAVGSKVGRIHIYDFRHFHCDSVNAHSTSVTTLLLSDDGKLLASYSQGASALTVWQVGSTMLNVIRTQPKCIQTWPVVTSGKSVHHLEWQSNKNVILHYGDGLQSKYSIN